MRLLTFDEVLLLYYRIMRETGGAAGLLNEGAVKLALAQPKLTFDGEDLYPTLASKASAVGHSLIANHPFMDGNKRIGHAVMEAVLLRNGYEITASVGEQEQVILEAAQGTLSRVGLSEWLETKMQPRKKK
ncbi:MAG: type II toxin-antitoxin system death-on-curing family toxin [Candidatus Hydrogenedentes bacterium]|nr:type II toxin-antitoxin system death-on-curing family toxin [Candidatus Hydrogenedentota bacterium]